MINMAGRRWGNGGGRPAIAGGVGTVGIAAAVPTGAGARGRVGDGPGGRSRRGGGGPSRAGGCGARAGRLESAAVPPRPAAPARRSLPLAAAAVFLFAATLAATAAGQAAPGPPAGAGGGPVAPAVSGAEPDLDVTAPADRDRRPRATKRAVAEGAWYLFFVTAGALAALLAVAWMFGFYKRQFLEDGGPASGELFDARARAEIERHRREVQAERAAERAAEEDAEPGEDEPAAPAPGPVETETDPNADLAAQTAAPDPAVQAPPADGDDDRPA